MFSDEVLKQFDQGRRFPACGAHGHPSLHFDVPTFQCSTTSVPAMRCASAGSSPGAQSATITSDGDIGMGGVSSTARPPLRSPKTSLAGTVAQSCSTKYYPMPMQIALYVRCEN